MSVYTSCPSVFFNPHKCIILEILPSRSTCFRVYISFVHSYSKVVNHNPLDLTSMGPHPSFKTFIFVGDVPLNWDLDSGALTITTFSHNYMYMQFLVLKKYWKLYQPQKEKLYENMYCQKIVLSQSQGLL